MAIRSSALRAAVAQLALVQRNAAAASGAPTPTPTPTSLSALSWAWTEGHVFENTGAGFTVGTFQGSTSGSTFSIVSMTDGAGNALTGTPFVISGSTLQTGSTALDYEALLYNKSAYALVTVRETNGSLTKDTMLPVRVHDVPETGTLQTEDFNVADTPLRSRAGWTGAVVSGTTANQDNIAIVSNKLTVTGGGGATNLYKVTKSIGSTDYEVAFTLGNAGTATFGAPTVWLRYTDTANYVQITFASTGKSFTLNKRAGAFASIGSYLMPGNVVFPAGTRVKLRLVGGAMWVYVDTGSGWVTTHSALDISNVPVVDAVGFNTNDAFTASLDDFQWQAVTGFSVGGLQKVYPLDPATNMAMIPLAGGFDVSAPPASLEWRLETSGGTLVTGYDWQALNATISNGSWKKAVQVPKYSGAANYVVKVRDPSAPSTVATSGAFGAGYVIEDYGQSNMWFLNEANGSAVDSYAGLAWYVNATLSSPSDPSVISPNGYSIAGLTNKLVELLGAPVLVINAAVPSQGVDNLKPGGTVSGGSPITYPYKNMVEITRRYARRVNAVLMDQGEADALSLQTGIMTQSYWASTWRATYNALLADCGQAADSVPFGVAYTQGDIGAATDVNGPPSGLTLRAAQRALTALNANYGVALHKLDCGYRDNVHHAAADFLTKIGPRYAYWIAKKLGLSTYDRTGPLATTLTAISSTQTKITFDPNGASALDVTGVSTAAGFQLVQGTAFTGKAPSDLLAISGISVSGNDVTLTHAAVTSTRCVRYAVGTAVVSATTVFDGSEAFGQTRTSSGQSAAAQIKGTFTDQSVGLLPFELAA